MSTNVSEAQATAYEPVIGLEVHVELKTSSKMFCGCRNEFGAEPNSLVCPICLGMPGTLPVINRRAVEYLCKTGLALGCSIATHSKFDRKNYFYPDMPKNYQISQYDMPLTTGGGVRLPSGKLVRLNRIHLEEDTGKNLHAGGSMAASDYTLIDYNRAGVPLMEIVTEPDISSPDEAEAYLVQLKAVLSALGVSDVKMHEGSLRCDANVSVRPAGSTTLGTKAEVKNMNSFRSVVLALEFEIERQIAALQAGERIVQETRNWDETRKLTYSTRSKEQAHDYRYFPDPDLVPLSLDKASIERWRDELPELPLAKRERFIADYGLSEYDATILTADIPTAGFFEAVVAASGEPKAAANWLLNDVPRALEKNDLSLEQMRMRPAQLAELIKLVKTGAVSGKAAKEVCELMVVEGKDPQALIADRGLAQVSDEGEIAKLVDEALAANPDSVASYRAGKAKALEFIVGQVMKASRGKANVEIVRAALQQRLK
ncbi:MAG TPA: Asp-tRNA(Asn)/Glu-tRNA(Gln) amidotransferase subunit GatB [Candidatus Acidoferrales bacterium]|nr:Asp-tRNA(Asn)/Glu-tRNA(Gln) amidotransferase subunit GatB [Candidatus Acidoferrales bacterium]